MNALSIPRVRTALSLIAALSLAACGRTPSDERPPQPGDVVVARVEGDPIWASDVKREAVAQGLIGEGEPLDPATVLFRRVLDEVIDQELLAREAERQGLDDTPLARQRLEAARKRILGDMLVETVVDDAISSRAVEQLYEEQRRLTEQSEEFRARMILVRSREEADAVMTLLANGASFEALAAERSIDESTRFNGGDLDYFTADTMPPAFGRALGDARAGDTVGPFQAEGGWAILRVEDRRQEQPLTLEQARPQILRFLTYDQVRQLLERLRGRAEIEILLEDDPLAVPGAPEEPASAPTGRRPAAQPAPTSPTAPPTAPARPASAGGAQ